MSGLAPTLGPQVCHFISVNGVHGPGDKIGEPFELSDEELAFIYSAYELEEDRYRPGRWRRRYRRCIYSRRKGLRKSELMAQVVLAEFDGPVRFSGRWAQGGEVDEWGYVFSPGEPIGERVKSPEIPVVATTEEQAERLVWGVMRYVFQHTPLAARYEVQNDVIFFAGRQREAGWCYLIPPRNYHAADGAKPTFTPREEPHIWVTDDLRRTADVMDRNQVKRQAADPWTMDASTMYAPGEDSVLERSVKAIRAGVESILLDHRQASDDWDLQDDEQWLEAVREASGDAWPWTNISGIRDEWLDPEKTEADFRRYQLNQAVAVAERPFDGDSFDRFEDRRRTPGPSPQTPIVLMLDGKLTRDATALIGWTVEDRPHLFLAGLWQRPPGVSVTDWSAPKDQVRARVAELWDSYRVVFIGGDFDQAWGPDLTAWRDDYGKDRVIHVPTRPGRLMGTAVERWEEEWNAGVVRSTAGQVTPWTHDGSPELRAHFAAAVLGPLGASRYKSLRKASEGMGDVIDGARAAVAGWATIPAARVKLAELTPVSSGVW